MERGTEGENSAHYDSAPLDSNEDKTVDLKEMDDKVIDKLIMIIYLKCAITKAAAGLWFTSQHYRHIWEQCWICKKKYANISD